MQSLKMYLVFKMWPLYCYTVKSEVIYYYIWACLCYEVASYVYTFVVTYLEANISGREIVSKDSNRSRSVSSELLAVGSRVTGTVMPFDHRRIFPGSLKRDVRLRRRHYHFLSALINIVILNSYDSLRA